MFVDLINPCNQINPKNRGSDSIKAQLLKKRHYNSQIKANEPMCCISSVLDFFFATFDYGCLFVSSE